MGSCSGKDSNPYEEFSVTNINDQHRLVHSGVMYITETDLVYIDKKSHDRWEWPLKYLRRYGCEGNVFSFEAGRKCPTGEGLYAFNCKKANALFNRVAQNITQGNLEPTEPDLPERNADVPFPPKMQPSQHQPSSTSLIPNGTGPSQRTASNSILPISVPSIPPPLPPTPPPNNQNNKAGSSLQYTHLEFEKGSENKPPPPASGDLVNYTKIDMSKTAEASRVLKMKEDFHSNGAITRRQTTSNIPSKKRSKGGSRSSSCSSSSSLNTTDHTQVRFRSLDEGGKNSRRGSAPDIRNVGQQKTSPPLLPATVTEAIVESDTLNSPHTTTEPNYLNISAATAESQHTYSNMAIGNGGTTTTTSNGIGEQEQSYANITVGVEEHNYTNISVGTGDVPDILPTNPSPVPGLDSEHNYSNITVGMNASSTTNPLSSSVTNTSGVPSVQPPDSEHNYTNITVGAEDSSSVLQQSNYQNLIPGQGLLSSTPLTSPTVRQPRSPDSPGGFSHPRSATFNNPSTSTLTSHSSQTLPIIKDGGGGNMATYIELDMQSSSKLSAMSSYAELEISGNHSINLTPTNSDNKRQRSVSAITNLPQPSTPSSVPTTVSTTGADSGSTSILYQQLNFTEMEALRSLAQSRQHEKESGEAHASSHTAVDEKDKKGKSKK